MSIDIYVRTKTSIRRLRLWELAVIVAVDAAAWGGIGALLVKALS